MLRPCAVIVSIPRSENSNAALTFDNKNPGLAARMRNMFTSHSSEKHVTYLQTHDPRNAGLAVVHIDRAIKNGKYFLPIVDVPFIRFISPMETSCGASHVGNLVGAPCSI